MWGLAEVEILQTLLKDKLSFSKIAKRLGKTKGEVAGKVRREMNPRITRRVFKRQKARTAPKYVPFKEMKKACDNDKDTGTVKLMQLQTHHCRWLHGDRTYCGAQRTRGAYCEKHAAIAYVPDKRNAGR